MSKPDTEDSRLERARNAFDKVAYAKFLGLELCELKSGDVTVCLDVRDEMKQNHGVVHGGAIASLIDTASAFVILTAIDENERVTTTDLTIHYLRPVTSRANAGARQNRSRGTAAIRCECGSRKRRRAGRDRSDRIREDLEQKQAEKA